MINFNPVIEDSPLEEKEYPSRMSPFIFSNSNEKLIGTFFLTSGIGPHPTVLLMHGFPGNEVNYDIAHSIRRYGFNVMIFHYRGSWGSSGDFTFANSLKDVSSAIQFLNSESALEDYRVDKDKIIMIGHSFGGFAALFNAVNYNEIKNIASLAGFNFGYFSQFAQQDQDTKDATMKGLSLGSQLLNNADPQLLYDEMITNQNDWNLLNLNNKLNGKNILLVGAEDDTVSPLEIHHTPLVEKLQLSDNKITNTVLKSGHSFLCCRIKLNEVIIEWIKNIEF